MLESRASNQNHEREPWPGGTCGKCGATRIDQQIGLEATPDEWASRLTEVFREARRVLADHGTLWIECGDSYASQGDRKGGGWNGDGMYAPDGTLRERPTKGQNYGAPIDLKTSGLKPKDLIGSPFLLAFALRADGWYWRGVNIWAKPNPLPESVRKRTTVSHSYVMQFAKCGKPHYWTHPFDRRLVASQPPPDYWWFDPEGTQPPSHEPVEGWKRKNVWEGHDYFFDQEAVREQSVHPGDLGILRSRAVTEDARISGAVTPSVAKRQAEGIDSRTAGPAARNLRSVWTIDYDGEQWFGKIGFCQRCGGLKVAGLGPEDTTATDTAASGGQERSEHIESPTNSGLAPSRTATRSITSAKTRDASTQNISSPSSSESTSFEATLPQPETQPRPTATTGTNTPLKTLIDALTAVGSAASVCACEDADSLLPSVWRIATEGFPEAHFATWPQKLAEQIIKAACPEQVCRVCGKPRERLVEVSYGKSPAHGAGSIVGSRGAESDGTHLTGGTANKAGIHEKPRVAKLTETLGFTECECFIRCPTGLACTGCRYCENLHEQGKYRPGVVMDIFGGSGTTALVARRLGRSSVLIELNESYCSMAAKRLQQLSLLAEPA